MDTQTGVCANPGSRRAVTQMSPGSSPGGSARTVPASCKGRAVVGTSGVAQPLPCVVALSHSP